MSLVDVSVVIPTFRRELQLQQAIDSVLCQSGVSFQIIVVDDSPEGSAHAAVQARNHPLIRYEKCEPSTGGRPAVVRNLGARLSSGRYLYFLDDDDLMLPGTLSALSAALDAKPSAGMAFGAIVPFGEDAQEVENQRRYFEQARLRALKFRQPQQLGAGLVFLPAILINSACMARREVFERIGGYDAAIAICEDADLWSRMTQASGHVFVDRPVVNRRTGAPSLMNSSHNTEATRHVSYGQMQDKYRRMNGALRFMAMKLWARVLVR